MTFEGFLILFKGIIEFPNTILQFVKLLKKTPQEKHQDLIKSAAEEANKFEETGRPTWGN